MARRRQHRLNRKIGRWLTEHQDEVVAILKKPSPFMALFNDPHVSWNGEPSRSDLYRWDDDGGACCQ